MKKRRKNQQIPAEQQLEKCIGQMLDLHELLSAIAEEATCGEINWPTPEDAGFYTYLTPEAIQAIVVFCRGLPEEILCDPERIKETMRKAGMIGVRAIDLRNE